MLEFLITSIERQIFADPNFLLASSKNFGLFIAAELINTLSAPALKTCSMSFKLLIPPPTEIGINTSDEVFSINSKKFFLS